LVVLGVLAGIAILVVHVDTAFADDPLLRYGRFDGAEAGVTDIDCGAPVSNLLRHSEGLSLYGLAKDDACRDAASRRAATAVAAGGLVAVLGLVALTTATAKARTG